MSLMVLRLKLNKENLMASIQVLDVSTVSRTPRVPSLVLR